MDALIGIGAATGVLPVRLAVCVVKIGLVESPRGTIDFTGLGRIHTQRADVSSPWDGG